jgi:hypothetical protein
MREERVDTRGGQEPSIFTHHMVTTSPNHVVYGHGRHACPGRYGNYIIPPVPVLTLQPLRFFAATQLKTALAHVLLHYDIKAETEGVRPPDHEFSLFKVPNVLGRIYIRKRVM